MGDGRYQLYAQVGGRWEWLADIDAASHGEAFCKAMLALRPEHYDKPIRLEQNGDGRKKGARHKVERGGGNRAGGKGASASPARKSAQFRVRKSR